MNKIKIKSARISESVDNLDRIEKSFYSALDRFAKSIREIEITLVDTNGPKGGVDKHCNVQLRLLPRGTEIVRTKATTFLEAANLAGEKLKEVLVRRKERDRDKVRTTLREQAFDFDTVH